MTITAVTATATAAVILVLIFCCEEQARRWSVARRHRAGNVNKDAIGASTELAGLDQVLL